MEQTRLYLNKSTDELREMAIEEAKSAYKTSYDWQYKTIIRELWHRGYPYPSNPSDLLARQGILPLRKSVYCKLGFHKFMPFGHQNTRETNSEYRDAGDLRRCKNCGRIEIKSIHYGQAGFCGGPIGMQWNHYKEAEVA